MQTNRIKRFSVSDRLFHLSLMLTFIIQAATGFGRLYITTSWGRNLTHVLGGYEACMTIHKWVGGIMILVFLIHTIYILKKIDWKHPLAFILGPDSLVPNLQDLKHFWQQFLWSIGLGPAPRYDRWTYLEKFDYWAVYWGMPLLAITGLMAIFPLSTSQVLPGWSLNIAVLLHRAEAILAVTYIFVVHFFMGHLRPANFPMNEAMFAGSVNIHEAMEEKQAWLDRINREYGTEEITAKQPAPLFRIVYHIFGLSVLAVGIYLLVNGIIYSRGINLH
jgi:cytochrome b subunit of formate dehydrogenase